MIDIRRRLKQKVRSIVNRIGPELFKNFNKLKFIKMNQGIKSRASISEVELEYEDELDITKAFNSLKELENL